MTLKKITGYRAGMRIVGLSINTFTTFLRRLDTSSLSQITYIERSFFYTWSSASDSAFAEKEKEKRTASIFHENLEL